jgi:hypothetical protein
VNDPIEMTTIDYATIDSTHIWDVTMEEVIIMVIEEMVDPGTVDSTTATAKAKATVTAMEGDREATTTITTDVKWQQNERSAMVNSLSPNMGEIIGLITFKKLYSIVMF